MGRGFQGEIRLFWTFSGENSLGPSLVCVYESKKLTLLAGSRGDGDEIRPSEAGKEETGLFLTHNAIFGFTVL